MMLIQKLLVALIVAGCTAYAVWVLMPSTLRRSLAQRALKLPWPQAFASKLRRAAAAPTGCACDGCDGKPAKPAANTPQPIRIHRQPKA